MFKLVLLLLALFICHVAAIYTQQSADDLYQQMRGARTAEDYRHFLRAPFSRIYCNKEVRIYAGEEFEKFLKDREAHKAKFDAAGYITTGYTIEEFQLKGGDGFEFLVKVDYVKGEEKGVLKSGYQVSKKEDGLKIDASGSVCDQK